MSEELKANKELVLFENNKIRRQMYNGEWNYSIIDVVAVLTEQKDYEKSRKYWNQLKKGLKKKNNLSW